MGKLKEIIIVPVIPPEQLIKFGIFSFPEHQQQLRQAHQALLGSLNIESFIDSLPQFIDNNNEGV